MPFTFVRALEFEGIEVDAALSPIRPIDMGLSAAPVFIDERITAVSKRCGFECCEEGFIEITRDPYSDSQLIHIAAPAWYGGGHGERKKLRKCFREALLLALHQGLKSIAFPLCFACDYGFAKSVAKKVAKEVVIKFLALTGDELEVFFITSDEDYNASPRNIGNAVDRYIFEHYRKNESVEFSGFHNIAALNNLSKMSSFYAEQPQKLAFSYTSRSTEEINKEIKGLVDNIDDHVLYDMIHRLHKRKLKREQEQAFEGRRDRKFEELDSLAGLTNIEKSILERVFNAIVDLDEENAAKTIKHILLAFSDTSDSFDSTENKEKIKDVEIYGKAGVSPQVFSNIKCGKRPSKETLFALAIELQSDIHETNRLLACAGYCFDSNSKFDLIIEYFIKNRCYDKMKIQESLARHNQHSLTDWREQKK